MNRQEFLRKISALCRYGQRPRTWVAWRLYGRFSLWSNEAKTIGRWIRGLQSPSKSSIKRLEQNLEEQYRSMVAEYFLWHKTNLWQVPYTRLVKADPLVRSLVAVLTQSKNTHPWFLSFSPDIDQPTDDMYLEIEAIAKSKVLAKIQVEMKDLMEMKTHTEEQEERMVELDRQLMLIDNISLLNARVCKIDEDTLIVQI